jgi:hypothetical protein
MRWRLVDTRRFHVVPRGFNAPIPEPEDLRDELWARPRAMPGVDLDVAAQVEALRALLPHRVALPEGFDAANPMYGPLDAAVLGAMLARERPRRVVELGSGWSSQIIAASGTDHVAYDPHPSVFGAARRVRAQDVPLDVFTSLQSGDVLFVDTSHTVRTGGDVNRIVLDVLPRLAPGVLVHVHDILLPHEVDRRWLANGWYWSEQDLLHAFLVGNARWRVALAVHAAARADPQLAREFAPAHEDFHVAGAFWLRAS